MEHRLFNRNFKGKIWLSSNPTTTRFSFWDWLIKFNVTCRYFLITEHGSKIAITHETFHYYFLLITLPKGASNKILKTNFLDGTLSLFLKYNETLSTWKLDEKNFIAYIYNNLILQNGGFQGKVLDYRSFCRLNLPY